MSGVFGAWFTSQLLFDGVVDGMIFGLVAMGIVLIYRSTKVINFAVANLGAVGAGVTSFLVIEYGVGFWLAAALGLLAGTAFGALVELVVIRRLFTAPRVIVLVATIGIAQLALAIVTAYPEIDVAGAQFPTPIGAETELADIRIAGPQATILIVVPLVAVALGLLLNRTAVGRAVKASADNPDLARLAGISPKAVSTLVWAIAGLLATVAIGLLAADVGSAQNLVNLGPSTLVRGLAAAVIAGMVSFPRAFGAGIAVGVAQAVIRFNFLDESGLIDFLVFLAIVVAATWQSRGAAPETRTFSFAAKARPVPERLRRLWWPRQIDRAAIAVLAIGAAVLPLVVTQPSRHLLYTTILGFAICALSLTIVTGWAGQLSLGQMAFAGIGALLTAGFVRGINVDIGWGDTRIMKAGVEPLRLAPSIALAVLITAAVAMLVGAGVLRVRGLQLAIVTFALGLAASQYLYDRPILSGGFNDSVPLRRTELLGIDVTSQRSWYYVVLVVLALCFAVVARLQRTGVGRSTVAVRDNADGASAYTVSRVRTQLRAFGLAGGIAALGGSMLAVNFQSVRVGEVFAVEDSLALVSMVVIGGLGSISGAVLGALWVIGLPAFFPGSDLVPLLSSSLGLLVLLLYFPGGLVQIGHAARHALLSWAEKRVGPAPAKAQQTLPSIDVAERREPVPGDVAALVASDVVVRFGGITAVDGASVRLSQGEVLGLIGTNGAGKSTFMNAIGGYVTARGRVELLGRRIDSLSSAARAGLGLGRTFQAATLFPELTVRETVLVAFEARRRTGLTSSALFLPGSFRLERHRTKEADELIDFLGLGRYAGSTIEDLSAGTRRIVELAGLLALDARVLCLDEPTAGLAQRETEAFGPLILEIRRELGASMLVIEHDMPLIMSISDRVCCFELGRVIAEGAPDEVRSDPLVVASYLGTDPRAIQRSDTAAAT